jgi:hypothetical protein
MLPPDIALADHIVVQLNAIANGRFYAVRTWVPDWDARTELDNLQAVVQPAPDPSGELVERDQIWETWPIDIGFAKRLQAKDRYEIDELIAQVDEARELLQLAEYELEDGRQFVATGFEFLARFDPSQLNRQLVNGEVIYTGAFLSIVRIPFRRVD